MTEISQSVKASCTLDQLSKARTILIREEAGLIGIDNQIDTYFNVPNGILKLRQSDIDNFLIFQMKQDGRSELTMTYISKDQMKFLRISLEQSLGVSMVVENQREIWETEYDGENFFHRINLDSVHDLGYFIEIEIIDEHQMAEPDDLQTACRNWANHFGLVDENVIRESYGELLKKQKRP